MRPYQPHQLRGQLYQAVFGNENGDPQLTRQEAAFVLCVDGSLITLAELRRDLLNVIELMIQEMTNPNSSPPQTQDHRRPHEAEASVGGAQSSSWNITKARVPQAPARNNSLELDSERVAGPVDTQSPSSELQDQPPGTRVGLKYHRQPINAAPRPLLAAASHSPVLPGPVNQADQNSMQQWNFQGFGAPSYHPCMQNVPPAPAFAYYIPYPMVPPMQGGYPMYGRPQYHNTFIQPPASQQQYIAPQAYPSIAASGVNAASHALFVPETSQQASIFQRQHQETHRASSTYHVGANSRNAEWSNRVGRQGSVQPSLPLLPYRPGADDMCPKKVGGASVRLQELTRNGQPSYAMATSREIVPFSETAKNTKPAGWGVVKIGNVSENQIRRIGFVLLVVFQDLCESNLLQMGVWVFKVWDEGVYGSDTT